LIFVDLSQQGKPWPLVFLHTKHFVSKHW